MKKINLGHKSHSTAMREMKKYGKDAVLDSMRGVYFITYDETKVLKEVDADRNDHITQDEVVEYVHKIAPNKSRKEIISDIDTNENGRITKREVKDWVEKQDK